MPLFYLSEKLTIKHKCSVSLSKFHLIIRNFLTKPMFCTSISLLEAFKRVGGTRFEVVIDRIITCLAYCLLYILTRKIEL